MLIGRILIDPVTGEPGMVRQKFKHCASCITKHKRRFRWPYELRERKRLAGKRYRA